MLKRSHTTSLLVLPALLLALAAAQRPAYAQLGGAELPDESTGEVGIGSSFFNQFGGEEENFIVLNFRPTFKLGNLWIGLNVAVPMDSSGEVREESFDEDTDYLAMLRFLQYGRERDTFYMRFGELSQATIGHGSIVYSYFNGVDYNSPKTGGRVNFNFGFAGIETLVSDVYSQEGVMAARAYLRPFQVVNFLGIPFVNSLALGVSAATDTKAPLVLQTSVNGSGDTVIDLDADGNIIVSNEQQVTVYGADLEYYLIGDTDKGALLPSWGYLNVLPYYDYVQIKDHGNGKHYGVLLEIPEIPILGWILPGLIGKIEIQLERRESEGDYIPGYFDSLYEIQRYQYPTTSNVTTKQSQISAAGPVRGWFGAGSVTVFDAMKFTLSYEDYDDDAALGKVTVGARLLEGVIDSIKFRAEFTRTNVTNLDNLFALDENALLKVDAGYAITSFAGMDLFLNVHFERSWVLDPNTGLYTEADILEPSISTQFTF